MSIDALDRKSILFAGKLIQILAFIISGNYHSCDRDVGQCLREVRRTDLATHLANRSGREPFISIEKFFKKWVLELWPVTCWIRSWRSAVAGWAGQRPNGWPRHPLCQTSRALDVSLCAGPWHTDVHSIWGNAHLLWWKWRQMSEQDGRCIDWPCCKSCSALSLCRDGRKRDSASM